jgi:hypothetical protein
LHSAGKPALADHKLEVAASAFVLQDDGFGALALGGSLPAASLKVSGVAVFSMSDFA